MHYYRQSIAMFGIVLPALAMVILIGICYLLKSKMTESYAYKMSNYKNYEMGRLAGIELESLVTRQRPHIERWDTQLSQETASAVTTHMREITEGLPSKEIQQTAFEPTSTKSGFGSTSAQNSSQVRIAFRGTFRTMQKALLELETRMPRLQLQELKIDPSSNQSSLLNFQVSYTAWEN